MILTVYHPPSDRRGRVLGRIIGRRSNLVITDSEIRKKEICEWLDLHPSRVAVIPSAVVAPEATRSVNEVYEHFGLVPDANRTIVGQIARLLPFKGQMVLLEAAASVLLEFPNTMFLIVGYGTSAGKGFPSQLATRAEELGIQNQVRICGYSGSIGDVWQVIDIHAHASLFDSLPVSILEGMSLGKPAIVTATGGVQQLVADGTTGIVVEAGNAEALTKGMIALLREPQMAKRLGVAAKERFNSLYNPEHLTRNLENVLQEVCGSCNKKNIP